MPSNSNSYWYLSSYSLRTQHRICFSILSTHHTRRKLWLASAKHPHHRSLYILPVCIHPHRTRHLLRLIPSNSNVGIWYKASISANSNSFSGLRPSLRPNILLGSNSYYKPFLSYSKSRGLLSKMDLRGFYSLKLYFKPILCIPLLLAIHALSSNIRSPNFPSRNRF